MAHFKMLHTAVTSGSDRRGSLEVSRTAESTNYRQIVSWNITARFVLTGLIFYIAVRPWYKVQ